jgi:hypothetical protein
MGEYEPNDSRDVTGAGQQNQQGGAPSQAEGGRSPGQMGQQQGNAEFGGQGDQGAGQQGAGQQQQFDSSGGQMGGSGTGSSGTGSSGGMAGQAAGGVRQQLREHMEVIGADGVHLGTIDGIEGDRIKLTKKDSGAGVEGGSHEGHHHYLPLGLVAEVEGDRVRLSANADVAWGMEEEQGGSAGV